MQNRSPIGHKLMARTLIYLISFSTIFGTSPAFAAGNKTSATNTGTNTSTNTGTKSSRKDNPPQVVGQLTVYGSVTVNDKKAINGTTVFNDSRIKVACAKGNRAIVNLGVLGRVELNPGAQLVLRYAENLISGDLMEGNILVNSTPGVKVSINTSEGVTATDGQDAAIVPVRTQRGVRCVPMVMSSSSSTPVLNSAAIAAILLGAGGAAAVGAVVTTDTGSVVSPSN